jgi:quercetin dioxygenase-like cupin family protein
MDRWRTGWLARWAPRRSIDHADCVPPIVYHKDIAVESFSGGATYQTLVGDQEGSTPVRVGIQVSPPGYRTPTHSHPYLEVVTIIEGSGEV